MDVMLNLAYIIIFLGKYAYYIVAYMYLLFFSAILDNAIKDRVKNKKKMSEKARKEEGNK